MCGPHTNTDIMPTLYVCMCDRSQALITGSVPGAGTTDGFIATSPSRGDLHETVSKLVLCVLYLGHRGLLLFHSDFLSGMEIPLVYSVARRVFLSAGLVALQERQP
ncbi:hypothetical protein CBL_06418 [Carabus blaptoides fortunei]